MGQTNGVSRDQKFSKICGDELKKVIDSGDSEAMKGWIKSVSKKFRDNKEQWEAIGYAITNAENWGRYRVMLELAIKQIEVAQDIKTKCNQSDFMGGESLVSINTTLAGSYLAIARCAISYSPITSSDKLCLLV